MNFSDIKMLFPLDNGKATEATPEIAEKVLNLRNVKARIKALEQDAEELTFAIGEFISPNALLKFGDLQIATWKAQARSDFQEKLFKTDHPELASKYLKTSTSRVLRLTKPKA
jgi:predicted phage-related endonuclease